MKILILVDKTNTAIDRLAKLIQKYNSHLNIVVQSLHPKRPDEVQIRRTLRLWQDSDLVLVAYWKSGEKFKELYPEEFRRKKKILAHHNPYDVERKDWLEDYNHVTVNNSNIHFNLPYATLILMGLDFNVFKWGEYVDKDNRTVMMTVGRIEGKKGVLEVAKACFELDYHFLLVGRVSKSDYMKQVIEANPNIEFLEDVSDEELVNAYHRSALHVCNSVDNFESGTLPMIEAMACGVPVLTRNVGHVDDLYNGSNLIIRKGASDDYEDLKTELKQVMENYGERIAIRERAWDSIKMWSAERYAREYSDLFYRVRSYEPLVSIIIPTKDRGASFAEVFKSALEQDYENTEVIVVDSGDVPIEKFIDQVRKESHIPIKYFHFEHNDEYTLAKARNIGICEAQGEYVLFCDDRLVMDKNAVSEFMLDRRTNVWLWGVKDDAAKPFVENFSMIDRRNIIRIGMFNERLQEYGGMTQEVRTRAETNGIEFFICATAKAYQNKRAGSKNSKRDSIRKAKFFIWELWH